MKKIISLVLLAALLVSLAGCGRSEKAEELPTEEATAEATEESVPAQETVEPTQPPEEEDTDDLLRQALLGEIPAVFSGAKTMYLSEYLRPQNHAVSQAYTFIDLDCDGHNEMVVQTSSDLDTYIVLRYHSPDVLAFPFGVRAMGDLKTDGSFRGSNSAASFGYYTMCFRADDYAVICEASGDYDAGIFEIDGSPCSEQEFTDYSANWEEKEGVRWIWMNGNAEANEPVQETTAPKQTEPVETAPQEKTPYLQKVPNGSQPIYKGPGYDYEFVRTVGKPGTFTIVEEVWDDWGNLWGRLKSGAGRIDLTDIWAEEEALSPITAAYADDKLLSSGNYHHFVVDPMAPMQQAAFRANEVVTDVTLYMGHFDSSANDWFVGEEVYYLSELRPEKPLVVDIVFHGDLSEYRLMYRDSNGVTRYLRITQNLSGIGDLMVFYEE